jgi:tripartite ATP-independent transporter DctP family solute receptor
MRVLKSLLIAGIGALLATAPAAAQQPVTINVGHVLSEQSAYQVIFTRFAALMKERSQGRVDVRVQCCGQAGTEVRLIQSLRTGVIDGAFVGGSSLETVVKDYRVLSLPYVFDDNAQANRILQGPTGARMLTLLEPHGMVGLGWGAIFERNVGARKPITKVEDLRGLKIRVLQTPGFVEAYKALGTQPTPMAYGELFMALQNNVVDALEISPDAVVADRFVETIQHYALTKVHQSTTVFTMSKARFDALPADMRELARVAARDAIQHGLAEHDRLNREGLATVRARGIAVVEPDLAPFKEVARRSYDTILAEAPEGRALLAQIEAAKRGQ